LVVRQQLALLLSVSERRCLCVYRLDREYLREFNR
jgi:hypothetical protein